MDYHIKILGSGSALPTANRNLSAQVLTFRDKNYLIDCGEGTQTQMRKYKIPFQRIAHIFISHLHADHFLGLPGLLSSMSLLGRENELHLFGPKGLKEFLDVSFRISDTYLGFPLHFHETKADEKRRIYEDAHIEVYSFPLFHRIACTGFYFTEKVKPLKFDKKLLEKYFLSPQQIHEIKNGADFMAPDGRFYPNHEITSLPPKPKSYAYCCDTAPFADLISHIKGVDTLFHEATFASNLSNRAAETRHSTAAQAATHAKEAGAKKLILSHFSSRYTQTEDLLQEAQSIFANTYAASDGEQYAI